MARLWALKPKATTNTGRPEDVDSKVKDSLALIQSKTSDTLGLLSVSGLKGLSGEQMDELMNSLELIRLSINNAYSAIRNQHFGE